MGPKDLPGRGPALGLALISAASFLFMVVHAADAAAPLIAPDEFLYFKNAQRMATDWVPFVTIDGDYPVPSQLYSLLIAPGLLFFDTPTAFTIAHVINAALLASTAVPAYLLAREVTDREWLAHAAAALAVSIPWIAMSEVLMTENVAYPAFVWAVWAMLRGLSKPSRRADALALGLILVCAYARTQFLALLAVYPVALVAQLACDEVASRLGRARLICSTRDELRLHAPLLVFSAIGFLVVVIGGDEVVDAVSGNYGVVADEPVTGDLFRTSGELLAHLAVGTGVLPFVLAVAALGPALFSQLGSGARAWAFLTVLLVPLVLLPGASVLSIAGGFHDRYGLYLAPLLFTGMVVWLEAQRRPALLLMLGGSSFAALQTMIEWRMALAPQVSPSTAIHDVIVGRGRELLDALSLTGMSIDALVACVGMLLAVALIVARPLSVSRLGLVVVAPALVFGFVASLYSLRALDRASRAADPDVGRPGPPNWVDREIGKDGEASTLPADLYPNNLGDFEVASAAFWNASIRRTLAYDGSNVADPFFGANVAVDSASGRIRVAHHHPYVVTYERAVRLGLVTRRPVARQGALRLVEVARPYRAQWLSTGVFNDGHVSAHRRAWVRVYNPAPEARSFSVRIGVRAPSAAPTTARIAGRPVRLGPTGRLVAICSRVAGAGFSDLPLRSDRGVALPGGQRVTMLLEAVEVEPGGC